MSMACCSRQSFIRGRQELVFVIMAAIAVKDVSSYLSSKQSEESDKDLAEEWAQLEELHNKK